MWINLLMTIFLLALIRDGHCYNTCGEYFGSATKVPRCHDSVLKECEEGTNCKPIKLPEVSSQYNSHAVCLWLLDDADPPFAKVSAPGIQAFAKNGIKIIELRECPGLLTARRNQDTKGICTNQNSPLEVANLYLNIWRVVPGRYYFDCRLLDGSIITREVIVYDIRNNRFHETVILVNSAVQADANNLLENDTVLIIFRSMGLSREWIDYSPSYLGSTTVRTGCRFGGAPCITDFDSTDSYSSFFSYSLYCYFRPVLTSDDGLTISLNDLLFNITLLSVTLNVHPRPANIADPSCLPYSYEEFMRENETMRP